MGLEGQKTLCKDVAFRLGLELVEIFQESISGKVHPEKRPVFMKALESAQRSGGRLMVAKLDRLSREVYHVSGYTQKHLFGDLTPDLLIAESPSMSQMEIYLKAMISEEERRMIGERTRAALAERKKQGAELGKTGRAKALSSARNKTSEAIAYAKELRNKGYSYQAIADQMNADGFTTSRGGNWYAANVRLRLKNLEKLTARQLRW